MTPADVLAPCVSITALACIVFQGVRAWRAYPAARRLAEAEQRGPLWVRWKVPGSNIVLVWDPALEAEVLGGPTGEEVAAAWVEERRAIEERMHRAEERLADVAADIAVERLRRRRLGEAQDLEDDSPLPEVLEASYAAWVALDLQDAAVNGYPEPI